MTADTGEEQIEAFVQPAQQSADKQVQNMEGAVHQQLRHPRRSPD